MASGISDGWMGLDIGPETVAQFVAVVEKSATIVWNGCVEYALLQNDIMSPMISLYWFLSHV